jgi:formylmethanofuran dehydrogenase subunit E
MGTTPNHDIEENDRDSDSANQSQQIPSIKNTVTEQINYNEPQQSSFYLSYPPEQSYASYPQSFYSRSDDKFGPRAKRVRKCTNCHVMKTPSWRKSPCGNNILCNACGLYEKLHGAPRPYSVNHEGKTKAVKREFIAVPCSMCRSVIQTFKRVEMGGKVICESCYYLNKYQKRVQPKRYDPYNSNRSAREYQGYENNRYYHPYGVPEQHREYERSYNMAPQYRNRSADSYERSTYGEDLRSETEKPYFQQQGYRRDSKDDDNNQSINDFDMFQYGKGREQ